MEPESVKKLLEKQGGPYEFTVDSMPPKFIEPIVMQGLKIDCIERGRVLCSFSVPPRLLNTGNSLHGGATTALVDIVGSAAILTMGTPITGVSVEINVSYLDGAFVGLSFCSWITGEMDGMFDLPYLEKIKNLVPFSLVQEEIEIESKVLRVGKAIAVVSVELRNKKTGKVIAQGRHTKYLVVPSKM